MSYSEKEIKAFEEKDLRISKIALLKSLIESGRNGDNEVKENCEITERYVKFLYEELNCDKKDEPVACGDKTVQIIDWTKEAESAKVPVPNEKNIEVLLHIMKEYKKTNGGTAINPDLLLFRVYEAYNKYPTNKASVDKLLEKLFKN